MQSIAFERLADLADCLELILREAAVVRVKNRMHAGYNAALSAGSESRPRHFPPPHYSWSTAMWTHSDTKISGFARAHTAGTGTWR